MASPTLDMSVKYMYSSREIEPEEQDSAPQTYGVIA